MLKLVFGLTLGTFVLFSNVLFAQNSFKPGFVIPASGDTIFGEVANKINMKDYQVCHFKQDGNLVNYLPDQIKEFGVLGGKTFASNIIKNEFVEILIKGKLSLFKQGKVFFIKKSEDSVYRLESKLLLSVVNGKEGYIETSPWRGIIKVLISDCLSDPKYINLIQLEERSLTKLVSTYNNCGSSDQIIYKETKPWVDLNIGVQGGLNYNFIKSNDFNGLYYYMAPKYKELSPSFGVVLSFSSPRTIDNFSFQTGVNYIKSSYKETVYDEVNFFKFYHDTYIDLSTLEIPFYFNYSFPIKKNVFFVELGVVYDINLKGSSIWKSTLVHNNTVYNSEEQAFVIAKYVSGYGVGIGMQKSFKHFKGDIHFRYSYFNNINAFRDSGVNLNRLGFTLNFMRK